MTMISVKDLKKTFGKNRVLRDIDVEIDEGEIVVVVGSSGSGKSTFLRCLNLLEEPTSGEIIVDGVKITDPHVNLNALRQTIGMVFQQFNLFPNLSVIENIKLAPKKLRKLSDKKATRLARGLLDPEMIGEVLDVIRKVAEKGMTMVIVTHEMKFAREVGTRMIFLDKGEIIENGTPAQVMDRPKTERAKKFFAK